MLIVYAKTNGIPIIAMVSIVSRVFSEDAALYIVRLYSGEIEEIRKLGNKPTAKRAIRLRIAAADERKAKKSLPRFISLGMLAMASILRIANEKNAGCCLKGSTM